MRARARLVGAAACSTSAAAPASTCRVFARRRRARVVGVEPHPPLVELARDAAGSRSARSRSRCARRRAPRSCRWRTSVDVAHARWAYFFGPGCEPGPGRAGAGAAPRRHGLRHRQRRDALDLRRLVPAVPAAYDPVAVERFWARQGWTREQLDIRWAFDSREDLRVGGADRVPAHDRRRHPGRARRARASTTPSTSGGAPSPEPAGRVPGPPRRPVGGPRRLAPMAAKAPTDPEPRPAATAAPSAAGRRSSGSAGAASARPGASVSEIGAVAVRTTAAVVVDRPAIPIGDVDARRAEARSTGVGEFDRVLGGGLVPGAVVLVAGEPGIGKSTLLLDVAARAAREGQTVLYVSGEESAAQVRVRAERIEAMATSLYLASETDLATVLGQIEPDPPRPGGRRLGADHRQRRGRGLGRQRRPGPRGRRVAHPAGQVPRHRDDAGRPRHQGRLDRRAAGARAPGRRGGAVRGRPALPAAAASARSRTATARPTRSAASTCPTSASSGSPTPAGCSCPAATSSVPGTCVTVTLEGRRPLVTEVQALLAPSVIPTPGGPPAASTARASR